MTAGIWFYMTPQSPKPSMHDVMTGFFKPNDIDKKANIRADFGTTINIINGGQECGMASTKADSRGSYYNSWLGFFGLSKETGISCADQKDGFLKYETEKVNGEEVRNYGAGYVAGYWEQDWDGDTACHLVNYMTKYSLVARDDYKRCICDAFGSGAADCGQA